MRNAFNRLSLSMLFLVVLNNIGSAQSSYITNHYYQNPFAFNPSFAGYTNSTNISLTHRQQWLGIEGAPKISILHASTPLANNIGVGLELSNFNRGILTTTLGLATFAYQARFSPNQGIRFGISAGGGMQGINFENVANPNDPALLNQESAKLFLDGKFGLNYFLKQFNVGFTLTDLFHRNSPENQGNNNSQSNILNSFLVNASYKFKSNNGLIAFQPYFLYKVHQDLPNQYEAGGIVYLNNTIHAGGAYRQDYGIITHTGFTINRMLTLNYSYEFAPNTKVGFGLGTHEIQLALSFKRNIKGLPNSELYPSTHSQKSTAQIQTDSTGHQDQEFIELEDEVNNKLQLSFADVTNISKGSEAGDMQKGYYLVTENFFNKRAAKREAKYVRKEGYPAAYGYNSKMKKYYVYLVYSNDIVLVRQKRDLMKKTSVVNTWILKID